MKIKFNRLPGRYYQAVPNLTRRQFAVVKISRNTCELVLGPVDRIIAQSEYARLKSETTADTLVSIVNHKMKFQASTFGRLPVPKPASKPQVSFSPAAT